jgi:hypothetical protein
MKRVWTVGLVVGILVSLVACAPAKTVVLDDLFTDLIDPSDHQVALSTEDHAALLGILKIDTWKKVTRSADPQTSDLVLVGESGALYALTFSETIPLIAMDKDANGTTDAYFEAETMDAETVLAWRDSLVTAHLSLSALSTSGLSSAILELVDPRDLSGRFDLSSGDAEDVLELLQVETWEHLQFLPGGDLKGVNRLTLVSSGSMMLVVTLVLLPEKTIALIQDEGSTTLGVYKVSLSLGSAVLSKLKSLAEVLIPHHELASCVFTQGYIGPTQYIYDPSENDPAYYFTLSAAQQIAMLDWLKPTTWIKQGTADLAALYAEFAVVDAEGRTYYFTELSTDIVIVTVIDPQNPTSPSEYHWETTDFMDANTVLMSYFVPGGPSTDLLDALYTEASFYEGELMDMTAPDITVSLSAAQSKTIKDFIDPFSWKQAVDIPPMGPAIGFTLKDDSDRQYTFLFIGEYVLVSIRVDEESPSVWWKGSIIGAMDARTFLLTLAP